MRSAFAVAGRRAGMSAHAHGFTLIEIVVVVFIIAVMAGVAVLSISVVGGPDRQLKKEARRLISLIELAADSALMEGRDFGLYVKRDSYEFYGYYPDSGGWVVLDYDRTLRPRELPDDVRVKLLLEDTDVPLLLQPGEDDKPVPQVAILSSGEMTPFDLFLTHDATDTRYHIVGEPTGELKFEEVKEF